MRTTFVKQVGRPRVLFLLILFSPLRPVYCYVLALVLMLGLCKHFLIFFKLVRDTPKYTYALSVHYALISRLSF